MDGEDALVVALKERVDTLGDDEMSANWDPLSGKRVVILGLARQGKALARFAANVGADVVVSDLRAAADLRSNIDELSGLDIRYVFGEHPMSLLEGADVLAISGGVSADAPLIAAARQRGIEITNDSLEFSRRAPAPIMGVTGAAGKTTTTALTGAMGRATGRATWVGGNIGQPLIASLRDMTSRDLIVQELSSFQLEIWDRSPQIAAVLNITPNHLDRHKTMAAYTQAKANIIRYQTAEGVAILCADDSGAMSLAPLVRGRLRTFSRRGPVEDGAFVRDGQIWLRDESGARLVCSLDDVRLRGAHNTMNVLAAVTIADSGGIAIAAMRSAIRDFSGMPHRLEPVVEVRGVRYINDSIATAPERALAAIDSFDEPLILIAGGRDKDMLWEAWAEKVVERVRHVIVFGELADSLAQLLERQRRATGQTQPVISRAVTLDAAVAGAACVAEPGDVVLFAPGGTSFDAFRDFEERGRRFRDLVLEL
jgi:UDP-N-acetylmuramoylalanine--D-glutamate ligase